MNTKRELTINVGVMIFICLALCVISFALAYTVFKVESNTFRTNGGVDIDLNGGAPVITNTEFIFEPGLTVEKPFYVQNRGSWAVYYRLYFTDVSGELGNVIDATILDNDNNVLASGKVAELTSIYSPTIEDELDVGERKELKIRFHYPETTGNSAQGKGMTFELAAVGVQTKNNPEKSFE